MHSVRLIIVLLVTALVSPLVTPLGSAWASPQATASAASTPRAIEWQPWSEASFARATAEKKPLYLYLEAVWCHWCHVMQATTFATPAVIQKLNQDFIAVKVDHDAMPALANRYRAWGWPAQIWFTGAGDEIAKRSGYLEPQAFVALLQDIEKDPSPQTRQRQKTSATPTNSATNGSVLLDEALRDTLRAKHRKSFDPEHGGLKLAQKFLDPDSVEYDLRLALAGNTQAAVNARKTLDGALALIDPVWGGAYQYSTHGVWNKPHYEKIMRTQAAYLRIYALAYLQFRDPDYRVAAQAVAQYLNDFWQSPEGGFYTSQDADLVRGQKAHGYFALDDAARREAGMPRIDTHRYAQENGQAIEGLLQLFDATGNQKTLAMAQRAMQWTLANRSLPEAGFRHAQTTTDNLYLGDNLAMGRALLAFYRSTGKREWLSKAITTADFIAEHFSHSSAGFTGSNNAVGPLTPNRDVDENIGATRFFNLLSHYSGNPKHHALAQHGMRYLAQPAVAKRRVDESGILLADTELASAPVHVTVVGSKTNAVAQQLYRAALQTPESYKRVEWWDRTQGKLPNHDVEYPDLGRPAGFFCEARRCSLPQFDAAGLARLVAEKRETR